MMAPRGLPLMMVTALAMGLTLKGHGRKRTLKGLSGRDACVSHLARGHCGCRRETF